MKLCPIAIAVGCNKCPAFKPCPLKGVIGDYDPSQSNEDKDAEQETSATPDNSKAQD